MMKKAPIRRGSDGRCLRCKRYICKVTHMEEVEPDFVDYLFDEVLPSPPRTKPFRDLTVEYDEEYL